MRTPRRLTVTLLSVVPLALSACAATPSTTPTPIAATVAQTADPTSTTAQTTTAQTTATEHTTPTQESHGTSTVTAPSQAPSTQATTPTASPSDDGSGDHPYGLNGDPTLPWPYEIDAMGWGQILLGYPVNQHAQKHLTWKDDDMCEGSWITMSDEGQIDSVIRVEGNQRNGAVLAIAVGKKGVKEFEGIVIGKTTAAQMKTIAPDMEKKTVAGFPRWNDGVIYVTAGYEGIVEMIQVTNEPDYLQGYATEWVC